MFIKKIADYYVSLNVVRLQTNAWSIYVLVYDLLKVGPIFSTTNNIHVRFYDKKKHKKYQNIDCCKISKQISMCN